MKFFRLAFLSAVAVLFSGCATNKDLYNWGPYEPQIYAYFKGQPPIEQVQELEKHLGETTAKGEVPPPGFYAHLGMLYSKTGRDSEAMGMLEMEKKTYPESTTFIDNLRNGFKAAK